MLAGFAKPKFESHSTHCACHIMLYLQLEPKDNDFTKTAQMCSVAFKKCANLQKSDLSSKYNPKLKKLQLCC